MKVVDLIWKTLKRLDIDTEYDHDTLATCEDRTIEMLTLALNSVVKEITCDYIPLVAVEKVNVVSGNIEYSSFARRVVEIKRIERGGVALRFKPCASNVRVFGADGEVSVEYHYIMDELTPASVFDLSRRVTDDLIILGVLGDYCLQKGRIDDALMYDRRYRDALLLAMRDNRPKYVKARGWLV